MKIQEIIDAIKTYSKGIGFDGKPIDDTKSRDQVLYGSTDKECTGIVTTCFASAAVLREAAKLGCNFVIVHEALFWNHGDHQEWLQDNRTYQAKKKLLDDTGITVWRDHDYIHSGVPVLIKDYTDGIFYGFAVEAGWQGNISGSLSKPMNYVFETPKTAKEIADELIAKFKLNGTRIVGDPNTLVHKLRIVGHIDGRADNEVLMAFEKDDIDCAITLECTDYTFNEYVRDSAMLGLPKAIIMLGHFNTEEPGMKYMADTWLPKLVGDIPVHFVQSGDVFNFYKKY
jgi:putative NIF3 family GTP cyclohydrolase 1 type 2